jgi:AraC-like DNA-binding protein
MAGVRQKLQVAGLVRLTEAPCDCHAAVVASESESESVRHLPHPALRPLVAEMVGYRHEGLPPGVHRGLPSPYLTLVLPLDEPLVMAGHPDPAQPPGAFDALVGGLHLRPALIVHEGRQFGVQLSLTLLGARALLGAPAAALVSADCHLADVVGAPAGELTERLRAATTWPARFDAVERVLLRIARADVGIPPEVAEGWRLVTGTAGRLRIEEVARRVGWSPRHLGQRFRAETGLTPKEAARIARFDAARRRLAGRVARGDCLDLATLAVTSGFYDQAHLTGEWRAFSGLPPRRWLAAEHGFLQDDGAAQAAS